MNIYSVYYELYAENMYLPVAYTTSDGNSTTEMQPITNIYNLGVGFTPTYVLYTLGNVKFFASFPTLNNTLIPYLGMPSIIYQPYRELKNFTALNQFDVNINSNLAPYAIDYSAIRDGLHALMTQSGVFTFAQSHLNSVTINNAQQTEAVTSTASEMLYNRDSNPSTGQVVQKPEPSEEEIKMKRIRSIKAKLNFKKYRNKEEEIQLRQELHELDPDKYPAPVQDTEPQVETDYKPIEILKEIEQVQPDIPVIEIKEDEPDGLLPFLPTESDINTGHNADTDADIFTVPSDEEEPEDEQEDDTDSDEAAYVQPPEEDSVTPTQEITSEEVSGDNTDSANSLGIEDVIKLAEGAENKHRSDVDEVESILKKIHDEVHQWGELKESIDDVIDISKNTDRVTERNDRTFTSFEKVSKETDGDRMLTDFTNKISNYSSLVNNMSQNGVNPDLKVGDRPSTPQLKAVDEAAPVAEVQQDIMAGEDTEEDADIERTDTSEEVEVMLSKIAQHINKMQDNLSKAKNISKRIGQLSTADYITSPDEVRLKVSDIVSQLRDIYNSIVGEVEQPTDGVTDDVSQDDPFRLLSDLPEETADEHKTVGETSQNIIGKMLDVSDDEETSSEEIPDTYKTSPLDVKLALTPDVPFAQDILDSDVSANEETSSEETIDSAMVSPLDVKLSLTPDKPFTQDIQDILDLDVPEDAIPLEDSIGNGKSVISDILSVDLKDDEVHEATPVQDISEDIENSLLADKEDLDLYDDGDSDPFIIHDYTFDVPSDKKETDVSNEAIQPMTIEEDTLVELRSMFNIDSIEDGNTHESEMAEDTVDKNVELSTATITGQSLNKPLSGISGTNGVQRSFIKDLPKATYNIEYFDFEEDE